MSHAGVATLRHNAAALWRQARRALITHSVHKILRSRSDLALLLAQGNKLLPYFIEIYPQLSWDLVRVSVALGRRLRSLVFSCPVVSLVTDWRGALPATVPGGSRRACLLSMYVLHHSRVDT